MERKTWLTVISVVVAMLALSWNVLNTARSRIEISAVSSISLLQDEGKKDLQDIRIYFRDKPVNNLARTQVALVNRGNRPLAPDDFVQPIAFTLPGGASLLFAKVDNRFPHTLAGELDVDTASGTVRLKPELLNPGDELTISLYYASDEVLIPRITGRVKGVSDLQIVDRRFVTYSSPWDVAIGWIKLIPWILIVVFTTALSWAGSKSVFEQLRLKRLAKEVWSASSLDQLRGMIERHRSLLHYLDADSQSKVLESLTSREELKVVQATVSAGLDKRIETLESFFLLLSYFLTAWATYQLGMSILSLI